MFVPKFTICIIYKNGGVSSRSEDGDLLQAMVIAQERHADFPDAEVRIILDGVGVLHKFAPIKEENKP